MPGADRQSSIDVVIPVWNDEASLAQALPRLLQEWSAENVRVVDGGSSDGSRETARRYGVRLTGLETPSRARQMNAGAAASTADVIVFLHADTRLPTGARTAIARAVSKGAIGGAFSRRFDNPSFFLRFTCLTADWRGQLFGRFFGDQAIFSTRSAFAKVGGFPDQPLFEDFELSRRLRRTGRTVLLKPGVISSGRRFTEKGPLRQTLSDFALTLRYLVAGSRILDDRAPSAPGGIPGTRGISPRLKRPPVPGGPPVILTFLKAPVPGRVKTRLARHVGDDVACEIYRRLVESQVAALPEGWPVEIHFTPASARVEFATWFGSRFHYIPQSDGDLGTRLRQAASGAFARGRRNVLLIGGDCPSLDAGTLREAGELLDEGADVVIGPATDGGYYLLGLSALFESLFEEIPWGGPTVAQVTASRAAAAGLRVAWLDEKEDVDDLAAYRRTLAAGHLKR